MAVDRPNDLVSSVIPALVFVAGLLLAWPSAAVRRATDADASPLVEDSMIGVATSAWAVVLAVAVSAAAVRLPVDLVLAAVVVATAIWCLSWWWRRRRAEAARRSVLSEALPSSIELVAIVLGSGGTVAEAVDLLARHGAAPVARAARVIAHQVQLGRPLQLALPTLIQQLGDDYRPMVRALMATERDGAGLSASLDRFAEHARAARRRQLEARVRRLPVMLLPPLVVCLLPAVVIGGVVPLVLVSIGRVTS